MRIRQFREDHWDRLPTIRLQKAVLDNFKSVEHGEIVFACGKKFVPYGTESDILGLYGQNGSGKTSFIEALAILKLLMIGAEVPAVYAECVAKGQEMARLEFTFDLQYEDGRIRKVVYEFLMSAVENETNNGFRQYGGEDQNSGQPSYRVRISGEKLSMSGDFEGRKMILQPVIDTCTDDMPFGPVSKQKYFITNDRKFVDELNVVRRLAQEKSASFIFSLGTAKVCDECGLYSEFYQVILELAYYSQLYLHVVDTKSTGYIRLNYGLPLYTQSGKFLLKTDVPNIMPEIVFSEIKSQFENINIVLSQIVPGLNVDLHELSPALMKDGSMGHVVEIVSSRNETDMSVFHNQEAAPDGRVHMPFRYESDGIRKIVSVLSLIIDAYNEQSCTRAIDELDAGVFEYLLGEVLQTFQESGKGQFIFTSHNLRPLEVISKDYIYFTTTNPRNRYIRMKGIGSSNNLRNTYFREIVVGEQDEELYRNTKRFKIVSAFRKAGMDHGETT